jgi:hypothetical protein
MEQNGAGLSSWGCAIDLESLAGQMPGRKKKRLFLKGPIPWEWLVAASNLPNRVMKLALVLWLVSGMRRNRTFRFPLSRGKALGLSRDTTRRALQDLERVRLVQVGRKPGCGLDVTILDVSEQNGKESPCSVSLVQSAASQ